MKRKELYKALHNVLFDWMPKGLHNSWREQPEVVAYLNGDAGGNPLDPRMVDGRLRLDLYAPVFDGEFGTVGAKNFAQALKDKDDVPVDLHINSPGGSVFQGWTIYNMLDKREAEVVAYIDGLAGSIASVIAMAADERRMARGSRFMLHRAHGLTIGNSVDHRKQADVLDGMDADIAEVYASVGKGSAKDYMDMMDGETWLSASRSVKEGFASPSKGVAKSDSNSAMIGADDVPTNTNGGDMTEQEKAELEAATKRAEAAEAKVRELEKASQPDPEPKALFTSAVDGRVYTDQDGPELVKVAMREHEAKVESLVAGYPEGLRDAARALVSSGNADALKSLDKVADAAKASTATVTDPKAEDAAETFEDAVKAYAKEEGVTESQARIHVANTKPELL